MLLTVSSATPRATVQQQTSASRPRPLSDIRADDGTDRLEDIRIPGRGEKQRDYAPRALTGTDAGERFLTHAA